MLACVDVNYEPRGALAACLVFRSFADPAPAREIVARIDEVAPYEPGAFYRRELPCLLEVLGKVGAPLEAVVIDGYVWLSSDGRPGLGAHLFEALERKVPVIGVAKTAFRGSAFAERLIRGGSSRPLFITAAGVAPSDAVARIRSMHGPHRIPTLLKRVDRLCREGGS